MSPLSIYSSCVPYLHRPCPGTDWGSDPSSCAAL